MAISVTDIINIIQFVLLASILFAFWRFEMLIYKIKSQEKYFMSWISFGILITGRFLTYYFAGFLIVTIRCYISSDICGQETDIVRLVLSMLSLIASILFNNLFQFYQHITFPLDKAPWAKTESIYKVMHTIRMFLNALCLSLMDLLQGNASSLSYYIILLPFFFIQSVLLYVHYSQEIAFDRFVSQSTLLIDCLQWGLVTTAILVELVTDYSDISTLGAALTLSIAIHTFVVIMKQRRNGRFLRNPIIKDLSYKDQITLFSILYDLSLYSLDSMEYNKLKDFYFRHQHTCFDSKCPSHRLNLFKSTDHMGDCLLFSDEDLVRGVAKDLVWKQVFDTFFFHSSQDSSNNYLYFLEIFMKISKYNHILSSYYMLIEAKDSLTSRLDKSKYEFLQNMICEAYSTVRKKHEDYDAERVMNVESEFLQYKMSILGATLHAHKFWASLSSKQIKLEELMDLGDQLVESYMKQKRNYEELMKKQPDFAEAVLYNYQFCQNVMNFEVEAMNACMLYEKIQEKIRITKQNLYNLAKKDFVVIMVTNKNGKKNQVIMVNKLFEIAVGVQAHLVIDKNINNFMPPMISVHHDQFIDNYLKSYNGIPYTRIWNRVWVKKLDETVLPVKAYLISCISQTYGLVLVVFVEIAEPIPIRGILYEATTPFYLIADQLDTVTNITPNFKEKYFNLKDSYLADYKLNINEVFPYLANFTEEELDYGVCTQMNKTFFSEKHNETQKFVDVILKMNQYQFKLGARVQELIFVPDLKTIMDIPSFTSSSSKNDPHGTVTGNEGSVAQRNLHENEFDFSGGSMSSESSNAKSFKLMISLKQQLDLSKLPQSFVNLKRGVIIFFLIMIMTLIVLLVITVVKQQQFFNVQDEILNSLNLNQKLSNLALAFRMLSFISQRGNKTLGVSYQDSLNYTSQYYSDFYYYQTAMSKDYSDSTGELKLLLSTSSLQMQEITQIGVVRESNSSLFIGSQQYLSKVNYFLSLNETQSQKIFSQFQMTTSMSNLTQEQRDAWFVIQNQNENLRNYILRVQELFIEMSSNKENEFLTIILIINVICICVSVMATLVLAPTTSSIDNEQLNVILKWNIVQDDTKLQILEKIEIFSNWMASTEEDRTKLENLYEKAQIQREITWSKDKQLKDRQRQPQAARDQSTHSLAHTKHDSYMMSYDVLPSMMFESQKLDTRLFEPNSYTPSGFKRQSIVLQSMKNAQSTISMINEAGIERNINAIMERKHESSEMEQASLENSITIDRSFKGLLGTRKAVQARFTSQNVISSAMYHETANDMIIPVDKSEANKEESTLQERNLLPFQKQATKHAKSKDNADQKPKNSQHSKDKEKQFSNTSSYTYSLNDIMTSKTQKRNPQKTIAFGKNTLSQGQQYRSEQYQISEEGKEGHSEKIKKQFKKKDIKALFRQVKIRRYLAFFIFVVVIIAFQFSQYMIIHNLVVNQFKAIDYQKVLLERLTCLSTSFRFMLESFSQNKTMTLGIEQLALDKYILQTCGKVEGQISNFQKNKPLSLEDLSDDLTPINSGQACSWMFGEGGKQPNSNLLSQCQTGINGLLSNGLGNSISQMYYYMTNQLLSFQGTQAGTKTRKYLNDLVFTTQNWNYLKMLNEVIKPLCDTLRFHAKLSIEFYVTTQMTIYYSVFGVFLTFLAISLIFVIKYMLIALKKIVLRTKILIKIIPIQELKKILDRDREKEERRDQKESTVKIGLLRAAQSSGIVRHFTQSYD